MSVLERGSVLPDVEALICWASAEPAGVVSFSSCCLRPKLQSLTPTGGWLDQLPVSPSAPALAARLSGTHHTHAVTSFP